MERYNFLFPDGQTLSFEGNFVEGLKEVLGGIDVAVYRTADGFMIILARGRQPQKWFAYEQAEDVARFLLGTMAQVREELVGTRAGRLGSRELLEFLRPV